MRHRVQVAYKYALGKLASCVVSLNIFAIMYYPIVHLLAWCVPPSPSSHAHALHLNHRAYQHIVSCICGPCRKTLITRILHIVNVSASSLKPTLYVLGNRCHLSRELSFHSGVDFIYSSSSVWVVVVYCLLTVNKPLEVHQHAELACRHPTVYETNYATVSYGMHTSACYFDGDCKYFLLGSFDKRLGPDTRVSKVADRIQHGTRSTRVPDL